MAVPAPSLYHRWLGWHALALRRMATAAAAGIVVGLVTSTVDAPHVGTLVGWDAAALTFLGAIWWMIAGADGTATERLATREDLTRHITRLLLLAACGASLVAVLSALDLASRQSGAHRVVLIAVAAVTVIVSWTVVNTVFTLRYADQYYRAPADGIDFGGAAATDQPDYRDFAYLAFTIGVTYQVSDTAGLVG